MWDGAGSSRPPDLPVLVLSAADAVASPSLLCSAAAGDACATACEPQPPPKPPQSGRATAELALVALDLLPARHVLVLSCEVG